MQRRFVSDVSHELRTPLTTVRMAADVLHDARDDFDPATARSAELLQTELDRFEALLADLLEISRFDAGAAVLELERRRPRRRGPPGRRARPRPLAEQRGVTARGPRARPARAWPRSTSGGSSGSCATWSSTRSSTASGRRRSRRVDGRRAAPTSRRPRSPCATTASGCGRGEAALVFNRFWRADPARARTSGGTGLGLSIALEDARLHGGWLQAWGAPGEGAQFRLTLPRRVGDVLRQSPLPLVPGGRPGARR